MRKKKSTTYEDLARTYSVTHRTTGITQEKTKQEVNSIRTVASLGNINIFKSFPVDLRHDEHLELQLQQTSATLLSWVQNNR